MNSKELCQALLEKAEILNNEIKDLKEETNYYQQRTREVAKDTRDHVDELKSDLEFELEQIRESSKDLLKKYNDGHSANHFLKWQLDWVNKKIKEEKLVWVNKKIKEEKDKINMEQKH